MYTIIEQKENNLFQKTLDDLKTQIKFVGTFGFGITGLYETVQELLHGKYPTLSEQEIILIFLAALSYFAIDVVDDVKKLTTTIKEKGLGKYLTQTVETLKDFENIAIEVGKKAGHTISSLAELVGYVYLLIPILETVQRLIAKEGFDIVTLGIYLKSVLTSIGIFYTKNVFDRLIARLKRNVPKDNEDVIKEHIERKDELRRVLNKYEKDSRKISPELIIDLAIEDPSPNYEYLDWMVNQIKMGFFLGVDLKYIVKIVKQFHGYKDIMTKGRLLRVISGFKKTFPGPAWVWNNDEILEQILEDPTDINNYPGYGQLEQIVQMIEFSAGGSQPDLQVEQIDYLQKKGEQSTRKVVSDILKIIKEPDVEEEFYQLPDYFSGVDGDMYEFGDLEFTVYLNVVEYESLEEPFIVDAEMGGEFDDEIYVTITIGPDFSTSNYEDLQMILNDYVRHEIEHVIEATEGGDIESPEGLSPYDYYMQPHEVRAQKAGFNRRAKLEKKPVEDIIYDYLEYRQKIDKLSDEEKSNLTKTLSEHRGKGERYNQPLEEGDVIQLIYMDDPWSPVLPLTRGVVMGFEDVPGGEPKILVKWIIEDDNDNKVFRNMPMIPEVDVWKKIEREEDLINEQETEFKPSGKLGTITNPHPKTPPYGKGAVAGEYYVNDSTGSIMKFVPGTSKKPYHYTHTGKYAWKKEVKPPTPSEAFINSYFPCPDNPYGGASVNWWEPQRAKAKTKNWKGQSLKYWSESEKENYNNFAIVNALAANALWGLGNGITSRSEWCKTAQGQCDKGMFNRKGWEENLWENLQKGQYCCPRYVSTQSSIDEYVRREYGEAQGTPNYLSAWSVEVGATGKKQCELFDLIISEVDSEWEDPLYEFVTGLGGWFYNTFIECDDTWDCIQNALDGIAIVAAFIPGPGWAISVVAGLGSAGISIAKKDYAMGGAMLVFELFPATRIGKRIFKYGPKAVKSSEVDAVLNKMLKSDFDSNVYKSLKGDQKKTADYLLNNIDDIEADVLKAVKNLKSNRMSRDLMKLSNWELRQVAKQTGTNGQDLIVVVELMKNQAKNIDDYAKFFNQWRNVGKEIGFGSAMVIAGLGTYLGLEWVKSTLYGGDEELYNTVQEQVDGLIKDGVLDESVADALANCRIYAEILLLTEEGCNIEFNDWLELEASYSEDKTPMGMLNYYLSMYEEKEQFEEIKYILESYSDRGTGCLARKWKPGKVGQERSTLYLEYVKKAMDSGNC